MTTTTTTTEICYGIKILDFVLQYVRSALKLKCR
jgi:hypothetical protein